jgi:VCBS repeat-containing protein
MFGGNGSTVIDLNAASGSAGFDAAGGFTVPAEFLFHGEYERAGNDLKIIGEHGKTFVVHDYFKTDQLHTLFAPDGAALTGDIVAALAGPLAPGEYAQATPPQNAGEAIGRVATLSGGAVAVRNGVAVALNVGDAVLKGDVVQTQGGSAIGVVFADGSTFDLGANARMVLNEFVYNPAATSGNSSLINLVQGSIVFVAGQVAHTGDMKVGTPSATMGIRGTAVQVDIDVNNGTTHLSVLIEPGGAVGSFNIYSLSGALLGTVNDANGKWTVTPTSQLDAVATQVAKTPAEMAQAFTAVQNAFQTQSIGQSILQQNPLPPSQQNQQNQQNQTPDQNQQNNPQNQNPTQNTPKSQIGSSDVSTTKIAITDTQSPDGTANPTPTVTVVTPPTGTPETIPFVPAPTPQPPPPPLLPPNNTQPFFEANSANAVVHTAPPVATQGTLTFTDTQGDTHTVTVTPHAGAAGTLSEVKVTQDTNGSSEGTIAYTYTPAAGQTQTDVFDVTVTDSGNLSQTTQISFVLQDHPPVATQASYIVTETQVAAANTNSKFVLPNILGNVTDADGDTVTVATITAPTVSATNPAFAVLNIIQEAAAAGEAARYEIETNHGNAHLAIGIDGQVYLWSDAGDDPFQSIGVGDTATISFNYIVVDGFGGGGGAGATITVQGANDAAVISGATTGAVVEAGGVNNNIPGTPVAAGTLTDTDVDNPANTFQPVLAATPSANGYGTYTIDAAGHWTFTLDNTKPAVQALNNNGTLSDTFVVHTEDGTAQTITITINGANDAAVISGTAAGDVTEAGTSNNGGTPTATGTLTDTDIDNPANTFQAVSVPAATSFGHYTVDATGHWSYTLDNTNLTVQQLNTNSTPLTDTFNVLTQDGTSQTVSIAIHGANDAAQIFGATTGAVIEAGGVNNAIPGTPVATGTLSDSDIDNQSISFQVVSVPAASVNGYGKFTIDSIGNWAYTLDNTNSAVQALNTNGTLSDTFTVLTLDGTPQAITVTINGANDAAVISGTATGDVTEAGGVNNAIAGTPTATGTLADTDVDNSANTFQAVLAAAPSANGFGKYTVDATGHWSYTLDNNVLAVQQLNTNSAPLTDTFNVLTQDGTAQTVTITIHGANDAAVIIGATTGSVTEAGASNNGGTPVATSTLTDTDIDNPSISFQVVSVPAASVAGYGTFTIDSIGNWVYTLDNTNPAVQALNTNGTLSDTFTVLTLDGTPQAITVTINGANDAAVISGTATGDVTEAGGVNNAIPGTPTATGTLADTDVDNPANTFQAVSAPAATSFGHYTVDATGHWSYTLDNTNLTIQALNTNSAPLTDTFNVLTQDGTSQTVSITIHGANDAAVISGSTAGSVTAAGNGNNGTPTAAGTLTDTDVDNTPNTFQAVATATASANGYGTYTVDAAGHWSFTLDNNNATVQGLGPNATLGDTFVVLTQDGTAQTVSITVHGTDHPPTLDAPTGATYNDTPAADSFSPATGTLTGHDIDPGTTLTYGISGGAADNSLGGYDTSLTQSHGTLYVNSSTGAYRFVPNDAAINALTSSTTDTFTVTVTDGALSATQPFTVTLNGVNDTPVVAADTNTVTEHTIVTGNVLGNDSDADTGDVLSVAAVNGSAANVGQAIAGAYGTLVLGSDGHYTYTPGQSLAANQTANDVFTYTASDGHGGSTSANLTITVTGVNDAATVSGTTTGSVTEAGGTNNGTPGTSPISGVLFDTDPDNAANTFQPVAAGALSDQQYGTYAMTAGGTWTYTLNESNPAVQALNVGSTPLTDTFTVHTADGTPQQVTVTINGADDAPVVSGANSATLTEDSVQQWTTGQLTAIDSDQGATPLAWSIQNGAAALEDFHFALDDFKITRGGLVIFDDTFSDGNAPPSAPNFTDGSPAAYGVSSTFFEGAGRADLFGVNAITLTTLNGIASVGEVATLQTNGGANSLTVNQSFQLEGTFDLVIPEDVNERYGIRLTNAVPNQPGTNDIAVTVRHDVDGVHVDFGVANNATGTLTQLQEINLAPAAGDDQIVLRLSHAANANTITASFDLLHNGVVTSTTDFTVDAQAFITENFVSPVFFAAGPPENDMQLAGNYSRLTINQNGEWVANIRDGLPAVQALAQGQQVQDVYNVVVTDDQGVSTIKPITVTVTGSNDPPVLTLPGNNASTNENTALSLTGAHVSDPDNGDVITLNLSVAHGTISPNIALPNGVTADSVAPNAIQVHGAANLIDQLLNAGLTYNPTTDYFGPDALQVSVHDALGATDSQSVAINVVDTANHAPTLDAPTGPTYNDTSAADTFSPVTGTLTGHDIDAGTTFIYGISGGTAGSTLLGGVTYDVSKAGSYGTLYVSSATGAYDFVPNNAAINALSSSTTDTFTVTVSDGSLSAQQPFTVTLNGVDDAPVIAGVTTGAITTNSSQTSVFGALSATDADTVDAGATPAWTIVGGSSAHAPDFNVVIEDFQFTKNNGQAAPTVEDKFDDGTPPPEFANSGSTSNPPSGYGTTGTFIESNGRVTMTGANAGPASLNGFDPFVGDLTRLLTNTDSTATGGLKINQSFSLTGTFDLSIPEPRNSYGIRLTDFANGTGNDVVELLVATGPDGITRVQLDQLNAAGTGFTILSSIVLNSAQDNEIALTLAYTAPSGATLTTTGPEPVVASFQLLKSVSGSEVNDGSAVTLSGSGNIFVTENWTQAGFLAKAPAQADTILQGTYGTLDLTQYGTWTYAINNSLPATQALTSNQVVQDIFQVQATDAHGVSGTQTITVNVTGASAGNSAPVIDLTPIITEVPIPNPLPAGADTAAVEELAPVVNKDGGRFVAFFSSEVNPDTNNGNGNHPGDIYLYDKLTGTTTVLTDDAHIGPRPAGETFGDGLLSISADGATVVFRGENQTPDPLSPTGFDQTNEIYVYDRVSDTVRVLTNPANGDTPYNVDDFAAISGAGNQIVFDDYVSSSTGPGAEHLYVTDLSGQIRTDLTLAQLGISPPSDPNQFTFFVEPEISGSGRYLAFWAMTVGFDQGTGQTTPVGLETLYTYDRATSTYKIVASTTATNNDWPALMSNDGRYIVFQSDSNTLDSQAGGTANDHTDIFVYDRQANGGNGGIIGVTDSSFVQGNGDSGRGSISGNGRYVIFSSVASNLVAGDTNGQGDTFVYDTQAHTFQRVSVAADGTQGNGDSMLGADLGWGYGFPAFGSTAGNLVVPNDTDGGHSDIFVVDSTGGVNGAVTEDVTTPGAPGNLPPNTLSTHSAFHFTDANAGDAHTFLVTGEVNDTSGAVGFNDPSGGIGTFTPSIVETVGSGSGQLAWTFTVDNALVQNLNAFQDVAQTYTVQISDGHGGVVSQTVQILIFGAPDAPVLTLPGDSANTIAGAPVSFSGAQVTDPDNGDVIKLNLSVAHGTLTPNDAVLPAGITVDDGDGSDGTLQVHGSAAAINQLFVDGVTYTSDVNFAGQDTLNVTVHDAVGESDSKSVGINVAAFGGGFSLLVQDVQYEADGTLAGVNWNDTLTITPAQNNYIGTLSTTTDSGSVDWHFTASNNDLNNHAGETLSYLVQDQTAPSASQQLTVSIGGPGQDQFQFSASTGVHALVNFSTQTDEADHYIGDTVDLHNFIDGQSNNLTISDVLADLTTDSHGNAVINLGSGDSVVFAHVSQNVIQAQIEAGLPVVTVSHS